MPRLIDADAIGLNDFEIIMCDGDYKEALKMLLGKIDAAPTIEERHTGKWIASDDFDEWYSCSECRKGLTMFDGTYKYCPNCGAIMEGEK